MKHAAVKVKSTEKVLSKAKADSVKIERKISNSTAVKSAKESQAKSEKKLVVSAPANKQPKGRSADSIVVAFPKLTAKVKKSAPLVLDKKVQRKEIVPVVSPKKTEPKKSVSKDAGKHKTAAKLEVTPQTPKLQNVSLPKRKTVSVPTEPLISEKKAQSNISLPPIANVKSKNRKQKVNSSISTIKTEPKKEKVVPVATTQKIKETKKTAEVSPSVKTETKIAKNKLFVAINKINVIKKQSKLPDDREDKKAPEVNLNLNLASPETTSITTESAAKSATQKPKPKNKKPIGAAIFRGKKERYDFQVYPLDAEFADVSAIYIISKRKIDQHKRGHHALVCIGQTDSILGEIKKHKSKCIKKHNANVISILPEVNEKKRLRIEEDLKAAHAIACDI